MLTRRQFNKGLLGAALSGLAINVNSKPLYANGMHSPYGTLLKDPNGILDLPKGFRYKIISQLGKTMTDGIKVPDRADGMGCFYLDDERVILVRNHENHLRHGNAQYKNLEPQQLAKVYDVDSSGLPLPGGTSNIVYNMRTQQTEQEYMSLLGTLRNCSGGMTPWGSWLSCEEAVDTQSDKIGQDHGYVFEVPANSKGLVTPKPLKAMGRFNHEAACVDPETGYVYMTEDRSDSVFYRFIPNKKQKLRDGGQLQALAIKNKPEFDSRNWQTDHMQKGVEYACEWVNLDNVESPSDDLRIQARSKGAALFARGEGVYFADGHVYFCCTSGGAKKLGQIMRFSPQKPSPHIGLFFESTQAAEYNFGDNLCLAANGHIFACEDQYSKTVNNQIKGITPSGTSYNFARVRWQTEPAGVCFSPDGDTMFVNLYSPATTIAIQGPWNVS